MINIIVAIVVGLIIGAIAKAIMPGRDPGGIIVTILLGIAGSVVGNILAGILGLHSSRTDSSAFNLYGLILGVIGALILLAVYRLATGRSVRA